MVEHSAVNRGVVGSSPTRGAKDIWHNDEDVLIIIEYGAIAKW